MSTVEGDHRDGSQYSDLSNPRRPNTTPNSANDDIDEDGEYRELLADRARLLDDEANRQRIREELETYVDSLGSRRDEDGEHLVQFPRNYRQIVSLMTQKDVREENEKAQDGKATRQSWSRVLIESGLSKQQAFGILEDGDDDPDGNGGLAAKIALKMAHIRQLDTILEEKLGKNLYSSIVPRKQKRAKTPSLPTTTQDINTNGMKANMTKDEEDRLEKLLSDEVIPPAGSKTSEDSTAGESNNAETGAVFQECNEFTMADSEKEAIDELIASKSCSYPLFAIDEQDNLTDDAFLTPERLQRQRLSRVEQELRFLQEAPSVVIVGDDHDDGDNDDCRSEISYATVASSTCSTRSGVISRHDFRCFLAQQKESFRSTPTASADEIRRLLLSMSHGTSLSSSTVTATTG
uniref:Fibrous sheath-interacting protein 1 n=1 Tax=Phytophthora ramorum TaxID=164328 RepID=H3HD32_PHYRM